MRRFAAYAPLRLLGGLALLGASTVTLSCVPPYFPGLDAAARLISHMTPAGTIGPVSVETGIAGAATTVRFLPSRPAAASIDKVAITSGFTVASGPTLDYMTFVYVDANGIAQTGKPSGFSLTVSGADPNFPLYEYYVVGSPVTPPSIIVFRFDPAGNPGSSSYQEMQGNPATGQFSQPPSYALQTFAAGTIFSAGSTPVGGSIDPTGSAPDTFTFMLQNGPAMYTGNTPVNNPASIFPGGAAVGPITPLPGLTPRALVFKNVKQGSMVSQYRAGNAWVTVQWVAPPGTAMTGVTKRLDAVLSDGDLLSTEGGSLTLYDSSGTGTQVLSTPLHGMQFCYEAFVGSTPYVFFALPVTDRHGNMIFNVFAIPTSQVRTLGQ